MNDCDTVTEVASKTSIYKNPVEEQKRKLIQLGAQGSVYFMTSKA